MTSRLHEGHASVSRALKNITSVALISLFAIGFSACSGKKKQLTTTGGGEPCVDDSCLGNQQGTGQQQGSTAQQGGQQGGQQSGQQQGGISGTYGQGSLGNFTNGIGALNVGEVNVEVILWNANTATEYAQRCSVFNTMITPRVNQIGRDEAVKEWNNAAKILKPSRYPSNFNQTVVVDALMAAVNAGGLPRDTGILAYHLGVDATTAVVNFNPVLSSFSAATGYVGPATLVSGLLTHVGTPAPQLNDSKFLRACQYGCFTDKSFVKVAPEIRNNISSETYERLDSKNFEEARKMLSSARQSGEVLATPVLRSISHLNGEKAHVKMELAQIKHMIKDDQPNEQEMVSLSYSVDNQTKSTELTADHPVVIRQYSLTSHQMQASLYRAKDLHRLIDASAGRPVYLVHYSGRDLPLTSATAPTMLMREAIGIEIARPNGIASSTGIVFGDDFATGDRQNQMLSGGDALQALGYLLNAANYSEISSH